MPPPIWLRERIMEKRNYKVSNVRNNPSRTCSKVESENDIKNNTTDLQIALNENAKLTAENESLKSDLAQLCTTNENLLKIVKENKEKYESEIKRIHEEIQANDVDLAENTKKYLMQLKNHLQQIKELKAENEKLTQEMTYKKELYDDQFMIMAREIRVLQENLKELEIQNKENVQKASKYKNKLKYGILIINDLNSMLLECTKKPQTITEVTQTDNESSTSKAAQYESIPIQTGETKGCDMEEMLLSDIFFKSKTYYESDVSFLQKDS